MYILVNFTKYYGGKCTMAFKDFNDLKDSVIKRLNACGWSDKTHVDLRSIQSCIKYLVDGWSVTWRRSQSNDKFNKYRYDSNARNL